MRGAGLGRGQQGDLPRAKSGLGCGGLVGRPWSLPGQPRRPERDDGGSCSKRGGARGGERRGRAGASLPGLRGASPPAEPSPILMTGERARGQEIGAGSCGSGDSAASRRAEGGRRREAARRDGAVLLTPRRPSWGQDAGNRVDGEGGARRHWARRAAARPLL